MTDDTTPACTVCLLVHDGDCPPMTSAIARAERMAQLWYGGKEYATTRRGIASHIGAALLSVEEMARVLGESAKRHGDGTDNDPDDETGRWTYNFATRELRCRCGEQIAGNPTESWARHLRESQAEALRAAILGEAS